MTLPSTDAAVFLVDDAIFSASEAHVMTEEEQLAVIQPRPMDEILYITSILAQQRQFPVDIVNNILEFAGVLLSFQAETTEHIRGRSDMNEVYLQLHLPTAEELQVPTGVNLSKCALVVADCTSKDQGWATDGREHNGDRVPWERLATDPALAGYFRSRCLERSRQQRPQMTRTGAAMLVAFSFVVSTLVAAHAQTLRGEQAVTTSSRADEAVVPEVDAPVSLAQREVFGMALAALVIFVAAGGGTGGGGVLDPIYILIMDLSAKTAIPLSSITILGGAIGNLSLNLRRTRENSTEPLIDWDVILVMQPLLLLGATCGTFLNTIMPTWLLCILLVMVLSVTGTRTLQKAINARQKERWQCGVTPESSALLGIESSSIDTMKADIMSKPEIEPRVDVPWRKLGALVGLFVVILTMNVLRGGKGFDSPVGIDSSSAWYHVLVALPYVFLICMSYFSLQNLGVTYQKQQSTGYEVKPHEIEWTSASIRYFPMLSLAAGTVSGMFGIGGGIINGPLLLEVGIDASAASAMTATTVLFSSGMSAFNYLLMGSMDLHLAQLMLPMGFLMTSAFVRGLATLALAFAVVTSYLPEEGENPVKFGPVPTFPTGEGPYEPHETFRFMELPHETIGIVLAALVVLIASGAKIGGGAVLDAVYILEAIPLASVTIFGGALGDILLNIWKKPINSSSSLINWDMELVMQPMLLMGAAFGASIISWFSSWLFTIALIVYLGYIAKKVFEKTRAVGRDENWRWCSSREAVSLLGAPSFSFQDDGGFQYKFKLPWRKLGKNFGLFGATVLLTSLQGGKYFPSPLGIPPTSLFAPEERHNAGFSGGGKRRSERTAGPAEAEGAMADSGTQTRENGVSHKKRREAGRSLGGSESASKKIKLEDTTPPEANPNTMEAVREKNRALEIDMKEKNRRIAYLTKTCEALFRSQGMAGASFRCLRRQWFQLQDELLAAVKTVDPYAVSDETSKEVWRAALDAVNDFGQVRVRADELKLNLPEWFLTVARDADTEEPDADVSLHTDEDAASNTYIDAADLTKMEREVHGQLQQKSEEMKQLLQKLLGVVGSASQDKTKLIEYAHIIQEKRAAVAETLNLKQQLQACKTWIARLEYDVEFKEAERHQACRDYDRLSAFVKRQGGVEGNSANGEDIKNEKVADDEKPREKDTVAMVNQEELTKKEAEHAKTVATLRDNMTILSTKLYQERQKMDSMRRELDKLKALEAAWENDESTLIQDHEEKLKQLQDEKAQAVDEYNKIQHKAKDVEHHMTEKWEKKITKIQAEMSKTKSQIDEVNLKNVSLREKLSNASNYRDQLTEAKAELESAKRENVSLKAKVEREQSRADRAQASADNEQTQELTHKEKQELQQAYDTLKQTEMKNATDKLSDALKRLSEMEAKYQLELQEHHRCSSDREKFRAKIEDMKASSEASREENDALLLEIETMAKDLESMRHSRKKFVQQIEEKRNSCKKLHTLLAREEQAKAHCFEELAAARLQVSSLSTVHKHQKAFLESSEECLQAKALELEKMKEYVKTIDAEREASDAEKRKALRDAEVAKKIVASSAAESTQRQQQMLQEKQRPCEKCDTYRKKTEKYERQLQSAKSASSTGELTDLERFELRDLQKLVNCSVCQDRRKDVIISKCFHMFCKECIENNLKSRNRKCPTCKKMFGHDDVKTDDVLVLGDGDFSFSRGLSKHRGTGRGLLATSFDSESQVHNKYSNAGECINAVRSAHGLVMHDVDATKLLALPRQVKTGAGLQTVPDFFQYIVFNFPHSGQQRVHVNRALLMDFFESARDRLKTHGEVHVTLKTRPPYSNWFIEDQAKVAGFVLKERRKFNIRLFPGYHHRTTDPQAKKFEPDLCVTYVFVVNRTKSSCPGCGKCRDRDKCSDSAAGIGGSNSQHCAG
ncbi:hypothetical protein BBO99_00001068 [Phytophthora kernoviae]|uniref:RING-type E3 ubiquitin transferase n=1 Tax=Phytophthora kernoviae TaxID=325452 RepID=A0A3R7K3A3_9STRA|nr:hypothetical protein BBI17_001039 [Phytophthora kernoviae]RLN84762.1 hypothetical protein BBO99_00001068 [Phytophthora kernoviae]